MRDKKKILAVLVAATVLAGTVSIAVSADGEKYSKSYTIQNILSDYQYFTEGDLTVTNDHTVGAIVVGGDASITNFGDGATAVSYFGNLKKVGNYAATAWAGVDNGVRQAYYNVNSTGGTLDDSVYSQNGEFIDFDAAFSAFATQSVSLKNNGYTVSSSDVTDNILVVDLSEHSNIVIPYEIYDSVSKINLVGVDGIDELATGGYTLSFVGVGSNDMALSFVDGWSVSGANSTAATKYVLINGNSLGNDKSFKNITGTEQGGQYYDLGMNFILNYPDATGYVAEQVAAGHVVAPNATVEMTGGNFEGGVIAKSVISSSEGHFFPYNAVGYTEDESSSTTDSSSVADSSSTGDSSSVADSSSTTDSSSVADSSSTGDSSSVADSSSTTDSSSVADSSSTGDSSSVADSSSTGDSSSVADSSSTGDSSSVADSSSTGDSSSVADSSSTGDTSSVADSSSTGDTSSVADSSSTGDSSSVADSSSTGDTSSVADSSSTGDTSSVADSSSTGDTSSVADSSSTGDSSSVADSSSTGDTSSVADSSSTGDTSSVADSSSTGDSSSVADSSSTGDPSSVADSSSTGDTSSVADSSSTGDTSSAADSSSEEDSIDDTSDSESSSSGTVLQNGNGENSSSTASTTSTGTTNTSKSSTDGAASNKSPATGVGGTATASIALLAAVIVASNKKNK